AAAPPGPAAEPHRSGPAPLATSSGRRRRGRALLACSTAGEPVGTPLALLSVCLCPPASAPVLAARVVECLAVRFLDQTAGLQDLGPQEPAHVTHRVLLCSRQLFHV